ncbi:hypothetical protein THAOC_15297, partial [Thalassiosira oceanica]
MEHLDNAPDDTDIFRNDTLRYLIIGLAVSLNAQLLAAPRSWLLSAARAERRRWYRSETWRSSPPLRGGEPRERRWSSRGLSDGEEEAGYVEAELSALVRRAAQNGMKRLASRRGRRMRTIVSRRAGDASHHLRRPRASCLRDTSLSAPPTSWDDVAGDAGGAKSVLIAAVEWPRTRRHDPGEGRFGAGRRVVPEPQVPASSYVGEAEGAVRGAFGLQVSCAVRPVLRPGVAEEAEDTAWRGAGRPSLGCCPPTIPERDGRVYGSVEDGVLVLAVDEPAGDARRDPGEVGTVLAGDLRYAPWWAWPQGDPKDGGREGGVGGRVDEIPGESQQQRPLAEGQVDEGGGGGSAAQSEATKEAFIWSPANCSFVPMSMFNVATEQDVEYQLVLKSVEDRKPRRRAADILRKSIDLGINWAERSTGSTSARATPRLLTLRTHLPRVGRVGWPFGWPSFGVWAGAGWRFRAVRRCRARKMTQTQTPTGPKETGDDGYVMKGKPALPICWWLMSAQHLVVTSAAFTSRQPFAHFLQAKQQSMRIDPLQTSLRPARRRINDSRSPPRRARSGPSLNLSPDDQTLAVWVASFASS